MALIFIHHDQNNNISTVLSSNVLNLALDKAINLGQGEDQACLVAMLINTGSIILMCMAIWLSGLASSDLWSGQLPSITNPKCAQIKRIHRNISSQYYVMHI